MRIIIWAALLSLLLLPAFSQARADACGQEISGQSAYSKSITDGMARLNDSRSIIEESLSGSMMLDYVYEPILKEMTAAAVGVNAAFSGGSLRPPCDRPAAMSFCSGFDAVMAERRDAIRLMMTHKNNAYSLASKLGASARRTEILKHISAANSLHQKALASLDSIEGEGDRFCRSVGIRDFDTEERASRESDDLDIFSEACALNSEVASRRYMSSKCEISDDYLDVIIEKVVDGPFSVREAIAVCEAFGKIISLSEKERGRQMEYRRLIRIFTVSHSYSGSMRRILTQCRM